MGGQGDRKEDPAENAHRERQRERGEGGRGRVRLSVCRHSLSLPQHHVHQEGQGSEPDDVGGRQW